MSGAAATATVFLDSNCPVDAEGRVHHLHVKKGDVANRVLSVGDVGRAARIAKLFDGGDAKTVITSSRGFVTHTGTYNGVPVSVIATGMGTPMMDFVVRETRVVVDGPMAIVRFGTCGGLRSVNPGAIVIASKGCYLVRREPDFAAEGMEKLQKGESLSADGPLPNAGLPYSITKRVAADPVLSQLYVDAFKQHVAPAMGEAFPIVEGSDATADSFYSSQGRTNNFFFDQNEQLLDRLEADYPDVCTLEMETYTLLDLARASKPDSKIYASGAAIVLANRRSKSVVATEDFKKLEVLGGHAALQALTSFKL